MKLFHLILIFMITWQTRIEPNANDSFLPSTIKFVNAKPKPKGKGGKGKNGGGKPIVVRKRKLKIEGSPLEIIGRLLLIHGLTIGVFTLCLYHFCC